MKKRSAFREDKKNVNHKKDMQNMYDITIQ